MRNRLNHFGNSLRRSGAEQWAFLLIATILAVVLRLSLLGFKSADYDVYTKVWYDTLQTMGYAAFKTDFSNYSPPYLYLLYLVVRFLPNMQPVVAIKIPSIITDFVCAGLVYQIIRVKSNNPVLALLGYIATLLAPVMILNSSFWGQADSIYTAALLACLYFLLLRRNWLALLSFGIAFAFKLQAIFLAPLLVILWFRRDISWKYFLAIPAVYFIAILPSWLIGRPLGNLLTIYASQTDTYNRLTMHAPSLYAWFPLDASLFKLLYPAGLVFGIMVTLIFMLVVAKSSLAFTPPLLVEIATCSTLLLPFVLPKMHQRYFFPADILSIVFGFYFPAYAYVPIVINLVSFFSYQYFLFGAETFPMSQLSLVMLIILVILIRKLLLDLHPSAMKHSPLTEYSLAESD
ncbi:MAG: hypothetical protein ACXWNQ_10105 [Anaerolineales bacterium]